MSGICRAVGRGLGVLALALVPASAVQAEWHGDGKTDYRIWYPDDWSVTRVEQPPGHLLLGLSPDEYIAAAVIAVPAKRRLTAGQMRKAFEEHLVGDVLTDGRRTHRTRRTLGGLTGPFITYEGQYDGTHGRIPATMAAFYGARGTTGYVLWWVIPRSAVAERRAEANQIFESFARQADRAADPGDARPARHTIVIDGTVSGDARTDYRIQVTGRILEIVDGTLDGFKVTRNRGQDTARGSTATGWVGHARDGYRVTGDIVAIDLDRPERARVYVDGRLYRAAPADGETHSIVVDGTVSGDRRADYKITVSGRVTGFVDGTLDGFAVSRNRGQDIARGRTATGWVGPGRDGLRVTGKILAIEVDPPAAAVVYVDGKRHRVPGALADPPAGTQGAREDGATAIPDPDALLPRRSDLRADWWLDGLLTEADLRKAGRDTPREAFATYAPFDQAPGARGDSVQVNVYTGPGGRLRAMFDGAAERLGAVPRDLSGGAGREVRAQTGHRLEIWRQVGQVLLRVAGRPSHEVQRLADIVTDRAAR
jgi:hypothetical protein